MLNVQRLDFRSKTNIPQSSNVPQPFDDRRVHGAVQRHDGREEADEQGKARADEHGFRLHESNRLDLSTPKCRKPDPEQGVAG